MWIFTGASLIWSCWMSVLTATNSTWEMSASIIRLTAFRPAPPTPTMRITGMYAAAARVVRARVRGRVQAGRSLGQRLELRPLRSGLRLRLGACGCGRKQGLRLGLWLGFRLALGQANGLRCRLRLFDPLGHVLDGLLRRFRRAYSVRRGHSRGLGRGFLLGPAFLLGLPLCRLGRP